MMTGTPTARRPLRPPQRLRAFLALWQRLARSVLDPYRPERHYMRGPGPKWRAKHGGARRAADR